MRKVWKTLSVCAAVMPCVAAAGCGTHDSGSVVDDNQRGSTEFDGHSRYSIKVYVPDEAGDYQLMELSPQNAAHARQQLEAAEAAEAGSDASPPDEENSLSDSDSKRFSKKKQNIRAEEEGSVSAFEAEPALHKLAAWVYQDCGIGWVKAHRSTGEDGDDDVAWPVEAGGGGADPLAQRPRAGSSKWKDDTEGDLNLYWYVANVRRRNSTSTWGPEDKNDVLSSCDSVLAMQSQMLCTAGRMAELAESFSTIRLEQAEDGSAAVLVPPQSAKDRFLLRRLALEALATFAHAGEMYVGGLEKTCGEQLSYGYAHPQDAAEALVFGNNKWLFDQGSMRVPFRGFGWQLYETEESLLEILSPRAALYIAQYRRAAELLDGLLENVATDGIAQAEVLRAEGGIAAAWGLADATPAPGTLDTLPNSLRGAASLLVSRLEVDSTPQVGGPSSSIFGLPFHYMPARAPACSGAVPLKDAVGEKDVFDLDQSFIVASAADLPPKSLAQQRARSIVERLGIVVAGDKIPSAGLLSMVKEQMGFIDAYNAGMGAFDVSPKTNPKFNDFVSRREGMYDSQLEGLTDADFVYALKSNLALYAQLVGGVSDYSDMVLNGGAGFQDCDWLRGDLLGEMTDSGSFRAVVSAKQQLHETVGLRFSGMPRAALSQLGYSRFARASAASQCPGDNSGSSLVGNAYADVASLAFRLFEQGRRVLSVQNDQERVAHREWRELQRLETQYFAKHSISGITQVSVHNNALGQWTVNVHGSPAVAGTPLDLLPLAVYYGFPWVAECAAGHRSICDVAEVQAAELKRVTGQGTIHEDAFEEGGKRYQFLVNDYQTPIVTQAGIDAGMLVYLVRRPTDQASGEVLGAFKPNALFHFRGVSHNVREQLDRIFSRSHTIGTADKCLEANNDGTSTETCLRGIKENQYVPLANELTSVSGVSEDSWKHYLELARASAIKADELGRQIIELGTTRDLRAEAAAEELAGICGGGTNLSSLSLDGGTPSSDEDLEFNQCIRPDTVPVVFFQGTDVDTPEHLAAITAHHSYCKTCGAEDPPVCGVDQDPSTGCCVECSSIVPQGLGMMAPPGADDPPGIPGCAEFMGETALANGDAASPLPAIVERLAEDHKARFTSDEVSWFRKAVARSQFEDGALGAALSKLRLREYRDGTWAVFLNGSMPVLAGRFDVEPIVLDGAPSAGDPRTGFPLCLRETRLDVDEGEEQDLELQPAGKFCSSLAVRVAETLGFVDVEGQLEPVLNMQDVLDYERAMRRLAEAGLWSMARLTGSLPANVFQLLLPVKNLEGATKSAPWPMLYSHSRFTEVESDHYEFAPDANTFSEDLELLKDLEELPFFFPDTHLASLRNVANEERSSFLMTLASNANLFWGSLESPDSSTETITASGFYRHLLDGNKHAAWEIMRDPLDDGNRPKGTDLYRDGQLYGVAVRRNCNRDKTRDSSETIQGKYGDLFPWDASFKGEPTVLWTYDRCAGSGDGNGHEPSLGFLASGRMSSFSTYGSCTEPGSCTSGHIDHWRENDKCDKAYEQYNDGCAEHGAWLFAPLVSPTVWPPEQRVHLFVEPGENPEAALAGIGLLSCLAEGIGGSRQLPFVPSIDDPAQVPLLSRWIDQKSEELANSQRAMFVEDVPVKVVSYYQELGLNGAVGEGASSDEMLAMAQALEAVYSGFSAVYSGVRAMGDAVRNAEIALTSEELRRDTEKSELAVQRINTIGNMVSATFNAAAAAVDGGIAGYVTGDSVSNTLQSTAQLAQAAASAASLVEIQEQDELGEQRYDNSIDSVIQSMTEAVQRGYEQALDGMTQIRTGRLDVLRAQNALETLQNQARFASAKASGPDAVDLDGNNVADEIPVNIVYRRQFDVLKRRYETALDAAKRYAMLARLSVEQKLGVRMASLDENIGSLPPPSKWYDAICHVSGVDYAMLRTLQREGEVPPEEEVLDDFADQYVGDYIDQLEQFVEYYNIEYPFHEDDDAAVLSLRDDLVYGNGMCRREAKNLLYHSDALACRNASEPGVDDGELSLQGWKTTGCEMETGEPYMQEMPDGEGPAVLTEVTATRGRCLKVRDDVQVLASQAIEGDPSDPGTIGLPYVVDDGSSLSTQYLLAPSLASGVSLVSFGAMVEDISPTLGPDELDAESPAVETSAPRNVLYQTVKMEKGAFYRLSWLAQARNLVGAPLASGNAPYRVMVTDDEWTPLLLADFKASGSGWGERTYQEVYAPEDGYYHVAFVPLMKETDDDPFDNQETSTQSLALSSVQLEYFEPEGPADYEATTGTRMITKMDCGAGNGQLFRDSFVRRCYQGDCYYELTKPIQLTDNDIDGGRWDLPGIAEQNYNYRHRSLAVNVVGTGVLDCDGANPGCFSNGFVEYDLVHTAYNTALRDYGGEPRCFNFGEAEIKHGKALATERYLGIPMSSEDESLIGGEDFTKGAFHGRPLTGMYTLRIYESPQMRWENVEDIQLVLNYRYWSRVKRNPN